MAIESLTPVMLRDLIKLLQTDQRKILMRLVGSEIVKGDYVELVSQLKPEVKEQVYEMHYGAFTKHLYPMMLDKAVKACREMAHISDDEIKDAMTKHAAQLMGVMRDAAFEEVNTQRNRKSDPETIRRNIEMLDKRRSDSKTWSYAKLGDHYGVSKEYARDVIKAEGHWRLEYSRLGESTS